MPEVLGTVDDVTATRGYVVATFGSLNRLGANPRQAAVQPEADLSRREPMATRR